MSRASLSLSLGDVYSSIAYYLTHRQKIEAYLEQQKVAADNLQGQLESNPDYQAEIAELRSRVFGPLDHGSSERRGNADRIDRTVMLRLLIDQDLDPLHLATARLRITIFRTE